MLSEIILADGKTLVLNDDFTWSSASLPGLCAIYNSDPDYSGTEWNNPSNGIPGALLSAKVAALHPDAKIVQHATQEFRLGPGGTPIVY